MFSISPSFRVNFNFSMCKPIFSMSPAPICSFITNAPHSFLCSLFFLYSSLFFLCLFLFSVRQPSPSLFLEILSCHPAFIFLPLLFFRPRERLSVIKHIFSFVVLLDSLPCGIRLTYTRGGRSPARKDLYYACSIWKTIFHLLY